MEEAHNMNTGEILIYQNQEGNIKIDVRLEEETVSFFKIVQNKLHLGVPPSR